MPSESNKIRAVREYLAKVDKGDHIGASQHVTDDFVYRHSPKDGQATYAAGPTLNKAQVEEANSALQKNFSSIKTVIENAEETGRTVKIHAKTQFELKIKETPFVAEYEFDGDKISAVRVISESNFTPV